MTLREYVTPGRVGWLAAALALGAAVACPNDAMVTPGEIPPNAVALSLDPIEPLARESYTGIADRRRVLISSRPEWERFWNELASNRLPPPPAPEIDFDRRVVVAATMGTRPTGGHSIEIESVHWADDRIYVRVVERSPGAGCVTTQALTAPATAVEVEARPGDAVFLERSEAVSCE